MPSTSSARGGNHTNLRTFSDSYLSFAHLSAAALTSDHLPYGANHERFVWLRPPGSAFAFRPAPIVNCNSGCLLPIGSNFTLMPDPTDAALGLDRGFSHQRRRFSQSFWKSMLHAPAAHTFESFWKTRPLQQRRLTQVCDKRQISQSLATDGK